MEQTRFTVEQDGVAIRCQPIIDAEPLSSLERGDEILATEVFVADGIEWVRLAKGSKATRTNGTRSQVSLDLGEDGFVPTLDPQQGRLLRKHTRVVVEEKKEEGVLTKREIAEVLERSSDPGLMLPLESKYWTKQQLEMFVMSGGSIRPAYCSIPDERLMANTNMTKEEIASAVIQAADWITNADAILIGSGAGMGVDSGLGTFRGNQKGVWSGLEDVGLAYEEICQPKWFQEEPHLGWAFWNFCHGAYQATIPHEGYVRLREWGQRCPLGFFSFTSNIDSHWVSSGTPADRVLEVHGAVKWIQCSKPCSPDVWKAPKDLGLVEDLVTHRVQGVLPTCPKCRAVARPNVQMFGGDSGFSKARRGAQFSRYDAWLKQLEARPDKDSLRVTCVEVGCGLTVPTVRNELEAVVKKFPQARLIRVNPENPGLSNELADRGVSLPLRAGFAIEELGKQVFKEADTVTFILWGDSGGCEIRAPYNTSLGRLLRLCQLEEGASVEFSQDSKGVTLGWGGRVLAKFRLDEAAPASCFSEVKAAEGPDLQVTASIKVQQATFRHEKEPFNVNPLLKQRVENVLALLAEMNARFEDPVYQDEVMSCTSRREVMQQLRSVQYAVLPMYDIEASDKGTLVMSSWIGCVQAFVPDVQEQANKSMEVSRVRRMSELPAVAKPKPDEACREAPGDVPEPLQVTCSALPTEDGGQSADTFPVEATTHTTIGDLRAQLATALAWDEETARAVKFLAKQGSAFMGLRDSERVRKVVYVRGCPPLAVPAPVEVAFKEMAPPEGEAAKTFTLDVMSDDTVLDLRQKLGEALGWDASTRKRAKFLIRLNKESFGALKDHERVQARKVIYVHGAPVEPTAEARAAAAAREAAPDGQEREQEAGGREQGPEEPPGEVEVTILLNHSSDVKIPVKVRRGSTIRALKRMLADTDPTGRTNVNTFWLRTLGKSDNSEAFRDSKRLWEDCCLEVLSEPPESRSGHPECCTAEQGPVQVQSYFVAGSWCDFKPTEMRREGSRFVHTLRVGAKGMESFQILLGGSWDNTFYPNKKDANPSMSYKLQGPDNKGHGMNWMIGNSAGTGKNSAKPGERFQIIVTVDDKQFAKQVTWRPVRSA